ncbi:MAG: hypothetical protein LBE34_05260 [Flavobacteriaceae bacterium]|jgi:cyanate lyase|nr:hypothetical protein [Flavobacteriaceae bacterium]
MSKIAIVLKENHIDHTVLFKIKKVIDKSLQDIKQRIEGRNPLYIGLLFYNDHAVIATQLQELVDVLDDCQVLYWIYELDELSSDLEENQKISKEVLERILDWQVE